MGSCRLEVLFSMIELVRVEVCRCDKPIPWLGK